MALTREPSACGLLGRGICSDTRALMLEPRSDIEPPDSDFRELSLVLDFLKPWVKPFARAANAVSPAIPNPEPRKPFSSCPDRRKPDAVDSDLDRPWPAGGKGRTDDVWSAGLCVTSPLTGVRAGPRGGKLLLFKMLTPEVIRRSGSA